MLKHLHVYQFWGVSLDTEDGDEYLTTCPFCQHKDSKRPGVPRFYISKESAAFCCKSGTCGREGSWRTFLEEIYLALLKKTTDDQLRLLTKEQGIPFPILKEKKVAYCPEREGWIMPAYNAEKEVLDLRIYRKDKKEYSTKGAEVSFCGIEDLLETQPVIPVIIVEGWRDKLCLDWLYWRNKESVVVLSVPGSNTFKDFWAKYLIDRDVVLSYDHDEAGYGKILDLEKGKVTGSRKAAMFLSNTAHQISYVQWPSDSKEGYDPRDFITTRGIENPVDALRAYKSFIFSAHKDDGGNGEVRKQSSGSSGRSIEVTEIMDKASVIYKTTDKFINALKLSIATIISSRFPGKDHVWLFLVGPPGCGKTLIINLFEHSRHVLWQSTLSRTGLISGYNGVTGVDNSLLARLNNKCMLLKDYTEVLTKNDAERKEIDGILRGAYDGRVTRQFGNILRDYPNCKFNILSGVTPEIRAQREHEATLGPRFLHYDMLTKTNIEATQLAALNSQWVQSEEEVELKAMSCEFIDRIDFDFSPTSLLGRIPRWFRDRIVPLGRVVACLRTSVSRQQYGHNAGRVLYKPEHESPNRVTAQLEKLAVALSVVEDKPFIDEEIYDVVKRVAVDTVKSYQFDVVKTLLKEEKALSVGDLSERLGVPSLDSSHYVENLVLTNLITRNGSIGSNKNYHTTKMISDLWKRSAL